MKTMLSFLLMALLCTFTTGILAQTPSPAPPAIDLTKPTLFVVGYSHLDTQWRWCYPQTIREYIPDTLHDNFALFEKYPNYVFNFSGSRRYQMMKEYYPEDYARLKKYIADGRWSPCGSSVDENDANVPSAESLVRQVLYGNKYFRQEFGIASEEYMLPDCFGFPAALPSVLAHCGLKGFSTQKLTWGSAIGIPFKVGVWEGPDGSSIVAALDPGAYVGEVRSDLSANDSWLTRVNNNGAISGMFADYHYYGTGDMGGAPTEESAAMIEKSIAGAGPLNVVSGPADLLFKSITPAMRDKLPRYKGELLLTAHSAGSISSQAYMKRWNRKNEMLADAAEKAAVAAWWLGSPYPAQRLEDAWYLVLGSQMHDILPGTSHPKAYEYSWNDEVIAANQFAAVLTDSVASVASVMDTRAADGATPVVVFNPLSIEREDVVEINLPWTGEAPQHVHVTGPDGKEVLAQVLGAKDGELRLIALARVPSVGFATFDVQAGQAAGDSSLMVSERSLDNEHYRVKLDDRGDIASIFDKQMNRELLASPARLALQYEKPRQWPAWNMDWKDRQQPPRSFVGDGDSPPTFRIVERGPVRVAIEVTREHEGSTYVQTIRLCAGEAGDRVEFDNVIDWTTRERSLKATFPLTVKNPNATYDIQVGAIERPTNHEKAYEHPSHLWFDLTAVSGDYGVSVINDSKFASDKPDDSTLRLTLLYTPGTGGEYQDQGTQDIGRHRILYALTGHAKDWRTAGTPWIAARVNQPLRAFIVPSHPGTLGKSFSLASVGDRNLMISAMKKAEDSDEVVVRLRELAGSDAKDVRISLARPIMSAREVDGQERSIGEARLGDGALATDVRGYALRAFALKPSATSAKIAPLESRPLELKFDRDVISLNDGRDDGMVARDSHTFPGEQLPDQLTLGGVAFKIGSSAAGEKNAVICRGQDLALPDGDFDRVEVLAAALTSDVQPDFRIDGEVTQAMVPYWRGYIGQWDNRIWIGEVAEQAFNWPAKYGGLEPGYIKPAEIAWFCSHHHSSGGDEFYQYCYLFKISLDVPKGAKILSLPTGGSVMVIAATAVKGGPPRAMPAAPLFDTFDDRTQDSPRITPSGGSFADATEFTIEPRLYGAADSICYTLNGSDPKPTSPKVSGPILLNRTTTIKAALIANNGRVGPIAQARPVIDDRTPPGVVSVATAYREPTVCLTFSEPLEKNSAATASNYTIEPAVTVRAAALDETARRVTLTLESPLGTGEKYTLRIRRVADDSPAHNTIGNARVTIAAPAPVFHLAEVKPDQRGQPIIAENLPVKAGDAWTLNMFVRTDAQPENRTVIAGFGACDGKTVGGGRYLCKFANGVRFWAHNGDLDGKSPLELGKWQMLTATSDGKTIRLYKDGELLGERDANLADDEAIVMIAPIDPWENKRQFEGEVREVTIWNGALNQDAIRSLQSGVQLP
jgi:alpha-mannosidase